MTNNSLNEGFNLAPRATNYSYNLDTLRDFMKTFAICLFLRFLFVFQFHTFTSLIYAQGIWVSTFCASSLRILMELSTCLRLILICKSILPLNLVAFLNLGSVKPARWITICRISNSLRTLNSILRSPNTFSKPINRFKKLFIFFVSNLTNSATISP